MKRWMRPMRAVSTVLTLAAALATWPGHAETAFAQANRAADEQAVRKSAQDYLAAMARGDAKALAELWTADGDFVDEFGRVYPAKELIEAAAQNAGKPATREAKITASTIRFLNNDAAIEDGSSEVTDKSTPNARPISGRFTAVWVKQEGRWRLASLREARHDNAVPPDQLTDLDWMVGVWAADSPSGAIEMTVQWNVNHTFLLRDMKVVKDGKTLLLASQRIGWDPASQRLKAWTFDTEGANGDGFWSKQGDTWIAQATSILPDGQRSSSTNVLTRDGKDAFHWKSTARRAQGQALPDLEMKFLRKK